MKEFIEKRYKGGFKEFVKYLGTRYKRIDFIDNLTINLYDYDDNYLYFTIMCGNIKYKAHVPIHEFYLERREDDKRLDEMFHKKLKGLPISDSDYEFTNYMNSIDESHYNKILINDIILYKRDQKINEILND